jgi:D-threo-aldose 1-dehydrogenase
MTGPLTRLGGTNVKVPRLGFGAAGIGNMYRKLDDANVAEAIRAGVEHGLSYFDTAPHYGFGLSEARLGDALSRFDPSGEAVLSTKVGRILVPVDAEVARCERHGFVDAAPFEPVFDYSYDAVMRTYEESRVRLRRDRIDILYAHDLGRVTHGAGHDEHFRTFMAGGYRALRELRDSGAVGAIGLGANEWEICEQAMGEGDFDVFLLAGRYTLLEQTALDSFLPECARKGVSVVIGGPYNSGILIEGSRSGRPLHYNYEPAPAHIIERVRRLEDACDRMGVPLPAAALQFPLMHPQVAAVIPGLCSAAQVEETIALYRTSIRQDFWRELKACGLLHPDAPVAEGGQ